MKKNKIAIILWLYNTALASEFIDLLIPHKNKVDIFLGLCNTNNNLEAEYLFKTNFDNNLSIEYLDNAGTDILPTIKILEKIAYDYDIFFKLHSKQNNWGFKRQVNWRCILLNDLLYQDNFDFTVLQLNRKDTAIVGSKSFIMRNNEYTNSEKILQLCDICDIDYDKLRIKSFIGGNIFAAKTHIFKPLLHNKAFKEVLSLETGHMKDDLGGTFVHSSERLFGYMAEYHNQLISGAPKNCQIIYNHNLKTHRLHLVNLYNNCCYVQENPNIYGDILYKNKKYVSIKWNNVTEDRIQHYLYKNNTLVNSKYYGINTNRIIRNIFN